MTEHTPTPEATPARAAMSDERIAEIRKRCEVATPGPWGTPRKGYVVCPNGAGKWRILFDYTEPDIYGQWDRDCTFVANARTDLPSCLDEIERLRADLNATMRWYREVDRQRTVLQATSARLRAVIAERDATIRDLLPMAEAWYHHECEYGGYDPINGDWATEQHRRDERAISQARALVGEDETE